jgi:folate-binding protein YgfZ
VLRFIEVKGKDAGDFLHRVTAGTVKGVAVGRGRAGLLLTGQSKVIAQFDLLHTEASSYLLAAPLECAEALVTGLEALHFSEELEIRATDLKAGAERGGAKREDEFAVTDLVWPSPVPGFQFSAKADRAVPPGWDFARIAALVPWPPREWASETVNALEAGMLPVIDRHKGCYPGQEIVELSLNVGHPARVLVAVEGPEDAPWVGDSITSSAQENGKRRMLVRLPWARKDFLAAGFSRLASHWGEN